MGTTTIVISAPVVDPEKWIEDNIIPMLCEPRRL